MTPRLDLSGKRVLVTGASSGLGLEMARQLARDCGAHPVLVARRKGRLEQLRDELAKHGARAEVIEADMTRPEDLERMFADSTRAPLAGVILNAGVTYFGHATEQSPESVATLVATNVQSLVDLSLRFVRHYKAAPEGGAILLVSSMASFQPMPYQATYGGSKAFVTSFGLALSEELRGSNVSVTTFCPGGIATEMMVTVGLSDKYRLGHPMVMAVEPCARLALDAFHARAPMHVPGVLNKLVATMTKLVPQRLAARMVARDFRGMLTR